MTKWGLKERVSIVFQVPHPNGDIYYLRKKYTFSSHPQSNLAQDIESWTGNLPSEGDDVADLFEQPAMLNVSHTPKDDNSGDVWANIKAIIPSSNPTKLVLNELGQPKGYKVPEDSMFWDAPDIQE